MNKDFDDILAKKIRESLDEYPVAYEAGAWEEFSRNYLKKPPVPIIPLWQRYTFRIAAAVLVIVAALSSIYYSISQKTPADMVIAQQAPANTTEHLALPDDSDVAQASVTPLHTPLHTPLLGSSSMPPQKTDSRSADLFAKGKSNIQTVANFRANPQPQVATVQPAPTATATTMAAIEPLSPIDLLPLVATDSLLPQMPALAEIQTEAALRLPKTNVIKAVAGVQALSGIVMGSPEKTTSFYGAGLGLDLFIQKKIALSTNLQFVQTAYETPARTFFVSSLSLQRNPLGAQSVPGYAKETHYDRVKLNLVQLPLTMKYLISDQFFVNIGGISYMATNGTRIENVAQNTLMGRLHNSGSPAPVENSIQPFRSLYLGGGVRLPMRNNIILQVEPNINLPLGNILQDVNHTSLQWIGLHMSLYYGR
ncbi:hypothetical protein [Rhodoflexus sp.]